MAARLWKTGQQPQNHSPVSGGNSDDTVPHFQEGGHAVTFHDHDETWLHGMMKAATPRLMKPGKQIRSWTVYSLLMLTGVGVSLITFLVLCIVKLVGLVQTTATVTAVERWGGFAGGCAWVCAGTLSAAGAFLLSCWCPQAIGSGIPEVKVEIRGLKLENYFVSKVLCAKAIGLSLGQGAGLPIGKEGPFVHFAACLSNWIINAGVPRQQAGHLRTIMLTASVAVGVGASFSVPIAGVLFSLEFMPNTAWHNTTYWSCLGAALTGTIASRFLSMALDNRNQLDGPMLGPVFHKDLNEGLTADVDPASRDWSLLLSAVLGAICGCLGPLLTKFQQACGRNLNRWRLGKHTLTSRHTYVWMDEVDDAGEDLPDRAALSQPDVRSSKPASLAESLLVKERREWLTPKLRGLLLCVAVGALNSTLAYMAPPLRDLQGPLLGRLFSADEIDFSTAGKDSSPPLEFWSGVDPVAGLSVFIVIKVLMTTLALSLPLPAGCIAPAYVIGALIGRLYGHVVNNFIVAVIGVDTTWSLGGTLLPAHFALVGAASFGAAFIRSFSMAVAIFELAPLQSMELPLAVGTLTAVLVANGVGPSIFDAILAAKKLPGPLQFRTFSSSLTPVKRVMRTREELATVKQNSTAEDLEEALKIYPRAEFFAVVDGANKLVGALTKTRLLLDKEWLEEGHSRTLDFSDGVRLQGVPSTDIKPLTVPPKLVLEDLAVLFIMYKCDLAFVTEPCAGLLGAVQADDLASLQI